MFRGGGRGFSQGGGRGFSRGGGRQYGMRGSPGRSFGGRGQTVSLLLEIRAEAKLSTAKTIGCFIKCVKFEILFRKTDNNTNSYVNSKFFHLRMKHNVRNMSTCPESACIYALFEITDNFLHI